MFHKVSHSNINNKIFHWLSLPSPSLVPFHKHSNKSFITGKTWYLEHILTIFKNPSSTTFIIYALPLPFTFPQDKKKIIIATLGKIPLLVLPNHHFHLKDQRLLNKAITSNYSINILFYISPPLFDIDKLVKTGPLEDFSKMVLMRLPCTGPLLEPSHTRPGPLLLVLLMPLCTVLEMMTLLVL